MRWWQGKTSPHRWITARYVLALSLVATLVTATYLTLEVVVSEQASTAAVVNLSGRQRMLSQRIALYAGLIAGEQRLDRLATLRQGLADLVGEMRTAHLALTQGSDALGIPRERSAAMHALYFGSAETGSASAVNELVLNYLDHAQALSTSTGRLSPANADVAAVLDYGLVRLLPRLDRVVHQYQLEGEQAIARILRLERLAWLLALVLLIIEARFIFRPMARRIADQITALDTAQASARRSEAAIADAHEQLKSTHLQLLNSEKLASVGLLAAGLAHELNTPLGYVHANVGALGQRLDEMAEILDLLERNIDAPLAPDIRDQLVQRLARLDLPYLREDTPALLAETTTGLTRIGDIVNSLLGFAHPESAGAWAQITLNDCVTQALTLGQHEISQRAELATHLRNLPTIRCRPAQLTQLVLNLLLNAAQSMATRGVITVRSGIEPAGQRVWVEVADTGCGIPPANLRRVFDPFFTTKTIGKFAGLGLSVAWGIAEAHGGTLTVSSTVGEGSTFRLTLPCLDPHDAGDAGKGSDSDVAALAPPPAAMPVNPPR